MDTFFGNGQLAALGDLDGHLGLVAGVLLDVLNLLDNLVALEDLAEDDVLAIQPTGLCISMITLWRRYGME